MHWNVRALRAGTRYRAPQLEALNARDAMSYELYKVNTFTNQFYGGNPAGVVPLDEWLPDETLQAIAKENGFSETAFFIKNGGNYDLRWFTPACEIDLCGHATIATAYILLYEKGAKLEKFSFNTRSGVLTVTSKQGLLTLDMPATDLEPAECPQCILDAIGSTTPVESMKADDYLIVLPDEEIIINLVPDFSKFQQVNARGTILTAKSKSQGIDFISRWFGGPDVGVDEDPVTGSAHASLVPYWASKLGKNTLTAIQTSERRGLLQCENAGNRVKISGSAVLYFKGQLCI